MSTRRILAAIAIGWLGAAALTVTAPDAHASPSCGMGVASTTSWFGGFCDSPPVFPAGQHFHCSWGAGFEFCEYRWWDNSLAPQPNGYDEFGPVLR
jgi:hypothetical protein